MKSIEHHAELKKRFDAALALFYDPSVSLGTLASLRKLIEGINPELDKRLKESHEKLSELEKYYEGDVVQLTADNLPERTEEEKKYKRALLLFIKSWKDFESEIKRVSAELSESKNEADTKNNAGNLKKIFSKTKGPFGIITLLAVGAAVTLQVTSVNLIIKNNGCGTMTPTSLPIPLPGLSLPSSPIESNGSAVAVLPALSFTIDGTELTVLKISALKFNLSFEIPSNMKDVQLDGVSLLKKKTEVKLWEKKDHEIVFSCR